MGLWYLLKEQHALPVDQMAWPGPLSAEAVGQHFKLTLMSGRTMGVVFSKDVEPLKPAAFKGEVSRLTNISADRLVVLKPDSTIM